MLSVIMAGGAFVPLDPQAPITRLQGLIQDTSANLLLASSACRDVVDQLDGVTVVFIDEDFMDALPALGRAFHVLVTYLLCECHSLSSCDRSLALRAEHSTCMIIRS